MPDAFDPKNWREELQERAHHQRIIGVVLELRDRQGWSEAQTLGILAATLSDQLEAMEKALTESRMREMVGPLMVTTGEGETKVAVFLGNFARPMYDALKAIHALNFNATKDGEHDFYSGAPRFIEAWNIVEAVLAKVDGR